MYTFVKASRNVPLETFAGEQHHLIKQEEAEVAAHHEEILQIRKRMAARKEALRRISGLY